MAINKDGLTNTAIANNNNLDLGRFHSYSYQKEWGKYFNLFIKGQPQQK
jgi:hypothetical protein